SNAPVPPTSVKLKSGLDLVPQIATQKPAIKVEAIDPDEELFPKELLPSLSATMERFKQRISHARLRGKVCTELVSVHPNISSLQLLQEGEFCPLNIYTFPEGLEFVMKEFEISIPDDYPLLTLLMPGLPELTSLTVYNGALFSKLII